MSHRRVLLHLSLIKGIGPSTIEKIKSYTSAHQSWADVYDFSLAHFMGLGLSESQAVKLYDGLKETKDLDEECALIEKNAINWATVLDDEYPALLKEIYMPPPVIYWRGHLSRDQKRIAVVGARKTNDYGKRAVMAIVPELVGHGFEIVSGGAIGADTMAHQQAYAHYGKTIVVLGSGLLKPYPRENIQFFEQLIDEGNVVMSAFSLMTEPHPGNFPARNRIISGLSKGVVVVQAAIKSGARITAQFALEQGRDVFAIPGSIDDELSAGCNALIQEGAKLIVNAHDVLIEYGITSSTPSVDQLSILATPQTIEVAEPALKLSSYPLDSFESKIIAACARPASVDEIMAVTGLPLASLQSLLFTLQLDGMIAQDFMGRWARC
jgi:DNA protecting protein DprA